MLFVVAQDLTLFFVWPFLPSFHALRHLLFHFLQILDPITRERNLLARGRDSGPDVVFLSVERACFSVEGLVLALKIPILDCD